MLLWQLQYRALQASKKRQSEGAQQKQDPREESKLASTKAAKVLVLCLLLLVGVGCMSCLRVVYCAVHRFTPPASFLPRSPPNRRRSWRNGGCRTCSPSRWTRTGASLC